jgi:hypothetical protein
MRALLIVVLIAACLLTVAITGCGWGVYGDNTSLSEISKATKLKFPASTKLLHGQNRGFADSEVIAKVSMKRSDLSKFFASVPATRHTSRTEKMTAADTYSGMVKWWKPNEARHFITIKAVGNGRSETYDILVSLDDPHQAIVYLVWGED